MTFKVGLGVILNPHVQTSKLSEICKRTVKAHQGASSRCFVSHNAHLLLHAFVTYVCPLLEYNCVIWSSSQRHDIDLLEQV